MPDEEFDLTPDEIAMGIAVRLVMCTTPGCGNDGIQYRMPCLPAVICAGCKQPATVTAAP